MLLGLGKLTNKDFPLSVYLPPKPFCRVSKLKKGILSVPVDAKALLILLHLREPAHFVPSCSPYLKFPLKGNYFQTS